LVYGNKINDNKAYQLIKDSNYDEFGLDKSFIRLLEVYLELAEVNFDWVITGDNFLKNKMAMLEAEIEDLVDDKKKGGGDVGETIILLGKWAGYRVDPKEVTVMEFMKMISLLKKEAEEKRKLNNKDNGKG